MPTVVLVQLLAARITTNVLITVLLGLLIQYRTRHRHPTPHLIELPQVDVIGGQAVPRQQLGHRHRRAHAHHVRIAAPHHEALI